MTAPPVVYACPPRVLFSALCPAQTSWILMEAAVPVQCIPVEHSPTQLAERVPSAHIPSASGATISAPAQLNSTPSWA
jgi:hypothetical protein